MPGARWASGLGDDLRSWWASWPRPRRAPRRLLEQTALRLAGIRTIPDRLVSLADADARPIRKGKRQHPTQFGYTALVAEDERGFIVDHRSSAETRPTRRNWYPQSSELYRDLWSP